MKHIKLFEQFIKESQEEDIAYDILQDLLGERDPEELEMMDLVDAEDTVMAYGHKGAEAKKIAKALVNLAQSGAFESAPVFERDAKVTAARAKLNDALKELRDRLGELYDRRDELEFNSDSTEDEGEIGLMMDDIQSEIDDLVTKRDAINKKLEALKGK